MKTTLLSSEEVLAGYDVVAGLYPHIPPMCVWRGWEYAGYRRYQVPEPVLDVGCGDGRFFRLLFPDLRDVVGIDLDPATAEASRRSGIYREVHVGAAHTMIFPPGRFAAAFANCALEHMDHIDRVLANVARSLRPGGEFLFSVVTDRWSQWATLPLIIELAGDPARARDLRRQHDAYHHLVNGFPAERWVRLLGDAGFELVEHVPIVPEVAARVVTFFDHLWHLPRPGAPGGEVGGALHPILAAMPEFPRAFRKVLEGAIQMEPRPETGSGAIFMARKELKGERS